jgi:recombinational DNA repair protein RecR
LIVEDSEDNTLLYMHELWRGSYDVTSEHLKTIDGMHAVPKRKICSLDKTQVDSGTVFEVQVGLLPEFIVLCFGSRAFPSKSNGKKEPI